MEARILLQCGECDVTREIVGEIPDEYTGSFVNAVEQDGWVPRPGRNNEWICRKCLVKYYEGHESVDDEEKVVGRRDPMT